MKTLFKRSIAFLVAVTSTTLILGMSVSASPAPRVVKDLCFVNTGGGNLNCRKSAGEEYSLVGKFSNGTELTWSIFAASDTLGRTWTGVSGPDVNGKNISGWVLDSYLRFVTPTRIEEIPIIINSDSPDVG